MIWEKGTATVYDVKEELSRGRKPAYSTILTMMRKHEAKGCLEHEVDERTCVYRSTISKEAVRHSMVGDVLDRVFEGSPSLLLNSLVEQNRISEKELHKIGKLIREREKNE